jgi:hypothetical protein
VRVTYTFKGTEKGGSPVERLRVSATVGILKILGFLVLVADIIMVIYIVDRSQSIKDHAEGVMAAVLQFGAPAAIVGSLLIVGGFVLDGIAGVTDAVVEGDADDDLPELTTASRPRSEASSVRCANCGSEGLPSSYHHCPNCGSALQ